MSRTPTPLYRESAALVDAYHTCRKTGREWMAGVSWAAKHESSVLNLIQDFLPHGSGIDNGVHIDLDRSSGERLVFTFGFHHMNDVGMYDGWTEHTLTVKPSLQFGYVLTISGRDRNGIKDYLHEVFDCALRTMVVQDAEAPYRYRAESPVVA